MLFHVLKIERNRISFGNERSGIYSVDDYLSSTDVKTRQKASFRIRFFLTTRTTLRFGKGIYSANLLVNAVER